MMKTMKPAIGLFAATALCSVAFAPMAAADTLQDLKAQLKQLQQKMAELEKKQAENQKAAKAEKPLDLKVKWKGAPEFSSLDGNFKMKVRGRMHFDYGSVSVKDGSGNTSPADKINGTEARTMRLGVEGVLFKNVKYKFEVGFEANEVSVKSATIQYSFKPLTFTVGQFKHQNSLDEETSSRYTTFMERGSFTDAFKLSRRVGVAVGSGGDNWTVTAGYFFEGFGTTNSSKNDENLYSARATYSPEMGGDVKLHLGTSFFERSRNGNVFSLKYSQRPHNHQAGKFVASQAFNVTKETYFGLEVMGIQGPFSAQAEWAWMKNTLANIETLTSADPTYNGGYVELSYFLTGESRSYSGAKGTMGRVKVLSPVSDGGKGAWQLAVRYDVIDLVHEGFGEKQDTYILGMNWHLNNYARVLANYSHSTVKNSAGLTNNKIDAFGARFQVDW